MIATSGFRQVARQERQLRHVVVIADFEIGVREEADSAGLAARLQALVTRDPNNPVVHALYMAGIFSRSSATGHGYILFTPSAIVVRQTDWASFDAWIKGEVNDAGERPDVQVSLRVPIEQTLDAAGV